MNPALLALAALSLAVAPASWPDLAAPPELGGGEGDAALIVGIERYAEAPPVPGAVHNAQDWYLYLTRGRKLAPARVRILRDKEASLEKIRKHVAEAAALVKPGGTLWFVFIGHGAPAADGKDGVLVGYDAQQDADSLYARSLPQRELLGLLARGQGRSVVILDACFSGQTSKGSLVKGLQPLIAVQKATPQAKTLVLTAGQAHQFAGPLPGAERPAFSYLLLGALRGWADRDHDGKVSAQEAVDYAREALQALLSDRTQTPELTATDPGEILAHGNERGPDLAALVIVQAPVTAPVEGASELGFESAVAAVAPRKVTIAPVKGALGELNLEAERALERAQDAEESQATPAEKAAAWCRLAEVKGKNFYAAQAKQACERWSEHARALLGLEESFQRLSAYLALKRKSPDQRRAAITAFLASYRSFPDHPRVIEARGRLEGATAGSAEAKSGLELVKLAGGTLHGGCASRDDLCERDENDTRERTIAPFSLTRTEVTAEAYQRCVQGGACTAATTGGECTAGRKGFEKHPVNCVDLSQARRFCEWSGGRLPTASEWEFAAKDGADQIYPWGASPPTGEQANVCDARCTGGQAERGVDDGWAATAPVGSFPQGATRSGLLDLAGNVAEWTDSPYDKLGRQEIRGGSWKLDRKRLRASARDRLEPGQRDEAVGFRCAK